MKMTNKYFDTSSLLLLADSLFDNIKDNENIVITSITLSELEHIKTSVNKDQSVKYAARQLLHKLDENQDKWECLPYNTDCLAVLERFKYEVTNDTKILAMAYFHANANQGDIPLFITNDVALKMLARPMFGGYIQNIELESDDYTGYTELYLDEEQMADFYSHPSAYGQNLEVNQYVNIYDKKLQERVDTLLWTGTDFRQLKYKSFISKQLGEIKPFKGDIYQAMVADSLMNNKITMIKGPAGAGKSHLAIGYLFSLLDRGKIDKIIIFCNTVATKNAAKLGFYPGSRDEKLLDSQIGNFLASKIGGKIAVEQLIDNEKLILLPMSDIRGYDTSGMNAGIYITEAQNLDVELLKLALQRVGEDSLIILDGDTKSQVDLIDYEGANNGMRRVSKVFRGEDIYGEVELKQIHRSRIAEIAQRL